MPNRIIKESICRSEEIDSLSWFEEVLFYRLIVNCDDYGRFDGRPAIIKGSLFPLKDVAIKDIEKSLSRLVAVGLVGAYEAQGKPVLQLLTWERHQNVRAKKSKYPAFDENCIQLYSSESNSSRNPIQSDSISKSKSETGTVSYDTVCRTDVQQVIECWNALEGCGDIKAVNRISSGTKRYDSLIARIKQYGIDNTLLAINRIRDSDFLQGKNKKGWAITFDWFVLPNNFIKVLEGNYDNHSVQSSMQENKAPDCSSVEQFAAGAREWASNG